MSPRPLTGAAKMARDHRVFLDAAAAATARGADPEHVESLLVEAAANSVRPLVPDPAWQPKKGPRSWQVSNDIADVSLYGRMLCDDPCSRCDSEPAAPHEPAHELDGDPHLCWGCREEIRTMREDAAFAAHWGGDDEGDD